MDCVVCAASLVGFTGNKEEYRSYFWLKMSLQGCDRLDNLQRMIKSESDRLRIFLLYDFEAVRLRKECEGYGKSVEQ